MQIIYVALANNVYGVAETLSRRLPVYMIKPADTRAVVELAKKTVEKFPIRLIVVSEAFEETKTFKNEESLPPLNPSHGAPQMEEVVDGLREKGIQVPIIALNSHPRFIERLGKETDIHILPLSRESDAEKFGVNRLSLLKEILKILKPSIKEPAANDDETVSASSDIIEKQTATEESAPAPRNLPGNDGVQVFLPNGFYLFGRHLALTQPQMCFLRHCLDPERIAVPQGSPRDLRGWIGGVNAATRTTFADIGLSPAVNLIKRQGDIHTVAITSLREINDRLKRRHLDNGILLGIGRVGPFFEILPESKNTGPDRPDLRSSAPSASRDVA